MTNTTKAKLDKADSQTNQHQQIHRNIAILQ